MNTWMDTWDIIDQLSFPIKFNRTVKDLIIALEKQWPKFLCNTLWNYGKWYIKKEKQNESQATICKKIEKSDWEIDIYNDKSLGKQFKKKKNMFRYDINKLDELFLHKFMEQKYSKKRSWSKNIK